MPENRLKQGFSDVSAHKRTPLQAILWRGFVRFTVFVVTLAKVSVKFMGIR